VYGNVALSNTTSDRFEVGMVPKYVHDNIAGANEKLEITPILSNIVQDLNISIRKPHLWFFNTAGRVFLSGERRTYEAYSRWGMDGGVGLEYKLTDTVSLEVSSMYERYSLERQTDLKKQLYSFVGFPIGINIDTRQDKIFSQAGIHCALNWTPYVNTELTLHQFSVQSKFYLPLVQEYFILAGWAQWDCLSGIPFEESPMDKRIFLGGVQNLRGYNNNSLGSNQPLNKDPKKLIPLGGLSSISAGIEPRVALYHPLWIALFCEAGFISQSSNIFKEFDTLSNLYWDIGFSVFYFTDFGPLRADIAYPLGKEPADGEKEFKFYISFGQAF
jgi:translocation and assembly module TamA